MRIKYVGNKPSKEDNVAGTGLRWTPGQVHEVASLEACAKLVVHSGVWVIDQETPAPCAPPPPAPAPALEQAPEARQEADHKAAPTPAAAPAELAEPNQTGLSSVKSPAEMGLDELKAFAADKGIRFHPNISKAKLLERLHSDDAEGSQP